MAEWYDATNYQRGERGNTEPRAWEIEVGGVRIWVGTGHIAYPGTWTMHCHMLRMDVVPLGKASEMTNEEAQAEAIKRAYQKATDIQNLIKGLMDSLPSQENAA